jgi:hypothetical protein
MPNRESEERSRLRLAPRVAAPRVLSWPRTFDRWDRPSHAGDEDFTRIDYSHRRCPRVVGGGAVHDAEHDVERASVHANHTETARRMREPDEAYPVTDGLIRNMPTAQTDRR